MRFEWDFRKNRENIERHGISFEEASLLLLGGEDFMEIFDATHSEEKNRYVAGGPLRAGSSSTPSRNQTRRPSAS